MWVFPCENERSRRTAKSDRYKPALPEAPRDSIPPHAVFPQISPRHDDVPRTERVFVRAQRVGWVSHVGPVFCALGSLHRESVLKKLGNS